MLNRIFATVFSLGLALTVVGCDGSDNQPRVAPARAIVRNTACTSDALNGQICRSAVRIITGAYSSRSCTVMSLLGAVGDTVTVAPTEWLIHSNDGPDRLELRCAQN